MALKTEGNYRVDCDVYGETRYATNAIRFDTPDEAEAYGHDLKRRWTMLRSFRVVPSDHPEREIIGDH